MFQVKRFWRKFALILGWSALVVSLSLYALWFSLKQYSEQILVETLKSQLSKDYTFTYEDFGIDLQNGVLHLEGLRLKPNKDSIPERKSYEFFLPKVEISIFSFQKLVTDRSLFITNAKIWDPEINIYNTPSDQDVSFSNASVGFLELISTYLFRLEVDRLEVEGGELFYQNTKITGDEGYWFHQIGLLIDRFAVDTSGFKHNFLNAQNISLNFSGDQYVLPDSLHVLSFDQGYLSTDAMQLGFKNLQLKPEGNAESPLNPSKNYFDLNLPEIRISGIDFDRFYTEQELNIKMLFLDQPSFVLAGKAKTDRGKNPDQNALRWLLNLLSPNLSIQRILIKDGYADLDSQAEKQGTWEFKLDSVAVYGFQIDPDLALFERGNYPFQKIAISIRDARKAFNTKGDIVIENMFLDSESKEVILSGVGLELPTAESNVAFSIPKVKITEVDIWEFLLDQEMQVGLLSLETPEVQWSSNVTGQKKDSFIISNPPLVNFPFKLFRSKILEVQGAKVSIDSSLTIGTLNFQGINLQIKEEISSWNKLFEQVQLNLSQLEWESPDQKVVLDTLSYDGDDLTFQGLAWNDNLQNQQKAIIPKFGAKNLNLDTLLQGYFMADTFQITDPYLELDLSNLKEDRNSVFPIDGLMVLNNARLDLKLKKGQLNADNIFIIFNDLKGWDFDLKGIGTTHFLSKDENLEVTLKRVVPLNQEDAYRLETADINLYKKNQESDSLLIQLDQIRAYGFDWTLFQKEGIINFDRLVLDSSRTITHFSKNQLSTKAGKTNNSFQFPKLRIDTLLLVNSDWSGAFLPNIPTYSAQDLTAVLYAIDLTNPEWQVEHLPEVFDRILLEAPLGIELDLVDAVLQLGPFTYNRENDLAQLSMLKWRSKLMDSLNIQTTALQLNGLPAFSQILNDSLVLKDINLNKASVSWSNVDRESNKRSIPFPLYFSANSFSTNQVDIHIEDNNPIDIQGLSFTLDQFFLDSSFQLKNIEDYYKDFQFTIENLEYTIDDQANYTAQLDLNWNTKKRGELSVDSFKLIQNISWDAFSQKNEYRKDYWAMEAYRVSVVPRGLATFFQDTTHIAFINFGWVEARDFNDETKELQPEYNKMLHQRLTAIKHPFLIDSLSLGGNLSYTAIAPLTKVSGNIDFNYLHLDLNNISNIPDRWQSPMHLKASGMLYKQAPFWVNIDFDLADTTGAFKMEGRIDGFDLKTLNPILRPQAAIEINKGANRRILFNLAANDQVAVGDMIFRYRDLSIHLLDKNDLEKQGFSNSFLSFWANRLVNTNNPSWLRRRKGVIYFERDQQKAISHFWAHSLLSGVVSSIGMQNNKKQLRKSNLEDVDDLSYPRLLKEQFKEGKN